MLDQGILDQIMMNTPNDKLGDAIQMAKFRQAQGQSPSPVAAQPVMRGDGMPVANKGIQVASADNTAGGSIEDFVSKSIGEEPPAGPSRKPAQTTNAPTPQRKPQSPVQTRTPNPNAKGAAAAPTSSMMPAKTPAPTVESLAAQQGRGDSDPLISAIKRILMQNQLKMSTPTGQQDRTLRIGQ